MWKFIFSLLCMLGGGLIFGQEQKKDMQSEEKKDFRPYELKLGINVIRSGVTLFNSGLTTYELEGAIALSSYNLVSDYGTEKHRRGKTYSYENRGHYFRIGVDRNFTKDKTSGNVLSLGLRYARARFKDDLVYSADQGFGEQTYVLSNPDLSARWMEVVFNLRGKVVSNLYMGFTLRWQFARQGKGEGALKTYDIPGFGNTKRKNSTAFDYYVAWRISLPRQKEN